MNRQDFLRILGNYLYDVPYAEAEEAKRYFDELIQDAVESGKEEEAFIASLGDMSEIAGRIKAELIVNQAVKKPGMRAWSKAMWVLLCLCAPIAIPLAIGGVAIAFAFFLLIVSLMIVAVAAIGVSLFAAFWILFTAPFSAASVGVAMVWAGVSLVASVGMFYLFRLVFKGSGMLIRGAYNSAQRRGGRRGILNGGGVSR